MRLLLCNIDGLTVVIMDAATLRPDSNDSSHECIDAATWSPDSHLKYLHCKSLYIFSPASRGAPSTPASWWVLRSSSGIASTADSGSINCSSTSLNAGREEELGCLQEDDGL